MLDQLAEADARDAELRAGLASIREVAETLLDDKVQAANDARAVWAVVDGLNQRVDPYFQASGCDDDE